MFQLRARHAFSALLVLLLAHAQEGAAQLSDAEKARCRICHGGQFASTSAGPHSALNDAEWAAELGIDFACTACHGDAREHIAAGGQAPILSFLRASAPETTAVCLGCHDADHPRFAASPHSQAGLSCTNCHSQHGGLREASLLRPVADFVALAESVSARSALCIDCHREIEAQFALNEHHRLREGILECTSCHDPHERSGTTLLGGFRHEVCLDCHADKGGPFVYEHPVSRVEGCTACHSPHGSQNRHLLNYQRVGELCISCHAEIPQFHLGFSPLGQPRFGLDTQCTNCHSAIHGSHFSPFFLE